MTAWHYTVGAKIPLILEDELLRPTAIGVLPPEKPVLWFSINQQWEPTANKMVQKPDGTFQLGDRESTRRLGNGLYRFGLPAEDLLKWTKLHREAQIPSSTRTRLVKAGKKSGSNPYDWFGSLKDVPIEKCKVEFEDPRKGEWVSTSVSNLRDLFFPSAGK